MLTCDRSWNLFTAESEESVVSPAFVVNSKYDDELVNLVAENRIYRISKILLSQSPHFSTVLGSYPGGQAMYHLDVSISELESFLKVLYARQTEARLSLQPGEWGDALHLSTKWGFSSIRKHVIKQIEIQCEDQELLDRFEVALKCHVPQWLRHVYRTLCTRIEYITLEEGIRLGHERWMAIRRVRAILLGEAKLIPKDKRCGRCDHCTFYTELPCRYPLEASGASALQWINKEEHLGASLCEEDTAESGVYITIAHSPTHIITGSSDLKSRPKKPVQGAPSTEGFPSVINASERKVKSPPVMTKTQQDVMQSYYPINERYVKARRTGAPVTIRPFDPATSAAKGGANQGEGEDPQMECSFCLQTKRKVKGNPLACHPCRLIQKTKQCVVCQQFKTNVQLETQMCKPCRKQALAAITAVKTNATPESNVVTCNNGYVAPSDSQNSQAKNPYLLQKSRFYLSDWKTVYMSKNTRGFNGSLEWFYDRCFDNESFSIWRCDYKYPRGLAMVSMSSDMIGGFFASISGSRNDIFASLGVLGEDHNSLISGVFICRGQAIKPLVRSASTFENYIYSLISLENKADRMFFEAALAWDLEIDGKKWACGKAFAI
ncbi:hypothetical protein FRB94_009782 [Tulasnella sp. JGI-2019a]|nr:hypothetical protein FRB94_009782 [Tulasnella sp. JGI-2019a]